MHNESGTYNSLNRKLNNSEKNVCVFHKTNHMSVSHNTLFYKIIILKNYYKIFDYTFYFISKTICKHSFNHLELIKTAYLTTLSPWQLVESQNMQEKKCEKN